VGSPSIIVVSTSLFVEHAVDEHPLDPGFVRQGEELLNAHPRPGLGLIVRGLVDRRLSCRHVSTACAIG
jgi:hypothetical protein